MERRWSEASGSFHEAGGLDIMLTSYGGKRYGNGGREEKRSVLQYGPNSFFSGTGAHFYLFSIQPSLLYYYFFLLSACVTLPNPYFLPRLLHLSQLRLLFCSSGFVISANLARHIVWLWKRPMGSSFEGEAKFGMWLDPLECDQAIRYHTALV